MKIVVSKVELTHDVECEIDEAQVWTVTFAPGFEAEVARGVPLDKRTTAKVLGSDAGLIDTWVEGDSANCWLDPLGLEWCDAHHVAPSDIAGAACVAVEKHVAGAVIR